MSEVFEPVMLVQVLAWRGAAPALAIEKHYRLINGLEDASVGSEQSNDNWELSRNGFQNSNPSGRLQIKSAQFMLKVGGSKLHGFVFVQIILAQVFEPSVGGPFCFSSHI